MVEFGGWEMPIAYPSGTIDEHLACRNRAVMFDVSHLGTVRVDGADAFDTLQATLTNDLAKIGPGRAQYTHLLDPADASVVDDIIVWWHADGVFDVMPNASNTSGVRSAIGGTDTTSSRAVIAVQGPQAKALVASVFPDAGAVGRFRVASCDWNGVACTVAGTGYTGEAGVEIAVPADAAPAIVAGPPRCARSCRRASVRVTRCASKRRCRCTATSSARASRRCKPASAGSWPGTSRRSSAAMRPIAERRAWHHPSSRWGLRPRADVRRVRAVSCRSTESPWAT